jgi:hypothetical protein
MSRGKRVAVKGSGPPAAAWRIGCFGRLRPGCLAAAFWALLPAEDPPPLSCPACGGPARFRGWCHGLQDVVPHVAPLLPGTPTAVKEGRDLGRPDHDHADT